jgi:hypothetical protein
MATVQLAPQTAQTVSDSDKQVAAAWAITAWEWSYMLTDMQRAHYRANVSKAPNFGK